MSEGSRRAEERIRHLARAYSDDAATYDEYWSPVIRPAGESLVRALVRPDHQRVLDVAAGTGALTGAIREAAPGAVVVDVDVAEGMLKLGRDRRDAAAVVAEAGALPVADGSVDAVMLAYVLFHLPDPMRALIEATRVVARGGRVGTVTWAEEHQPPAVQWWDQVLDEVGAPVPPTRIDNADLDSRSAMEAMLRRAGLEPIETFTEPIDHTFTAEQLWRLRTGFGGARWRLAQLDEGTRRTVLQRLEQQWPVFGPEQMRYRGRVVIAIGERP